MSSLKLATHDMKVEALEFAKNMTASALDVAIEHVTFLSDGYDEIDVEDERPTVKEIFEAVLEGLEVLKAEMLDFDLPRSGGSGRNLADANTKKDLP